MDENINHESTRMNADEWALQPPRLVPLGLSRPVNRAERLFRECSEHGARRAHALELVWFVFIGVHSWFLNGRREHSFKKFTTDFTDGHGLARTPVLLFGLRALV